jgi:putative restriction endonuclease
LKFWIGVTDNGWYKFLSERQPEEVNFWQPGGKSVFRALKPGEPFLFKLHSPLNFIVGGGFFVKHSVVPISLAWDAFEQKNGAYDIIAFREKVMKYRGQNSDIEPDPSIGCIILTQPFFFPKGEWIPVPENWSSNIVQGKTYDIANPIGKALWDKVQNLIINTRPKPESLLVAEDQTRYGPEHIIRPRLGQGAFRVLVTDAYNRRCAITGERTLPVLESAHIKPFSISGPHSINNGLLLRSDLHKLFDLGYITVTTDFNVEVSRRIKEEYENGREYYAFHGKELLSLPTNLMDRPSSKYIEWHNQNRYRP